MTQKDTNPYPYSDSNKRYMTADWYYKHRFSCKTARVPLNAGCTCPNIDGTRGRGGCIYCLHGSSSAEGMTLAEQYNNGTAVMSRKWKDPAFIPYFQSNTNTYRDLNRMRGLFLEAADFEGAVMLDIATRADCLSGEAISILTEAAEQIPLTVELGLQTSNDATAELINRCHTYAEFVEGFTRLKSAADEVNRRFNPSPAAPLDLHKRLTIAVHIINGLPGEDEDDMMKTARDVAGMHPDMIKIHLLHVLDGTPLAKMYKSGEYIHLERDEYVNIVCDQLEILPPDMTIARLTGDGMSSVLLAPLWSRRKTEVVNEIDKELYRRNSFQGKFYQK